MSDDDDISFFLPQGIADDGALASPTSGEPRESSAFARLGLAGLGSHPVRDSAGLNTASFHGLSARTHSLRVPPDHANSYKHLFSLRCAPLQLA